MAARPTGSAGERDGSYAASRLLANEARIFDIWAERLRKRSDAAAKAESAIHRDVLPAILRQLAEALTPGHPRRLATEGSTLAEEHGAERVRVTSFTLRDLVLEFSLLREVLVEVLQEERPLGSRELGILNASIDAALMKSSSGFMLIQAELRDRFLAILAHDLRTPLAVATA